MKEMLAKALAGAVVAGALLFWSVARWRNLKTVPSLVQCLGAMCLVLVILFHVFEALALFPSMGWGAPDSRGHYLDLVSAVFGVTLLPAGYLLTRGKSR